MGVVSARDADRERNRGFRFKREIGEHVLHQRLLAQPLAEDLALRCVPERLGERLVHQARARGRAVQARVHAHLEDHRHAAAFFAEQRRMRLLKLDFGARVRAVAELVFQSLDANGVQRAVGTVARQEEA